MTISEKWFERGLLLTAFAAMSMTAAYPVMAQTAEPAADDTAQAQAGAAVDDDDEVEEVIVTGSRIPRAGFDTLQPATVITSEFINNRGFNNIASALNQIPQFGVPALGGSGASSSGGQSANNVGQNIVDLFGLGSQRTLTLINGRRTVGQNTPNVGGANSGLQVDFNIIPTGLVERVETIETGGAPIYGSDAISGTVNVILRDDFEGLSMDLQYGVSEKGDAQSYRLRSLLGGNIGGDRGNVVISFDFSRQNALNGVDRPAFVNSPAFVPNPLDTGPADGIVDTFFTPDSLNVWQVPNTGFILLTDGAPVGLQGEDGKPTFNDLFTGAQILPRDEFGNFVMLGFDNNIVTLDSANLGTPFPVAVSFFSSGADGVNNPFVTELDETNTLISPLDRFIMNSIGHYDINDKVTLFYEGLFARSESVDTNNQPPWSTRFFKDANNGALGNYRININDNPNVTHEIKALLELNGAFDPLLVDDPSTPDVDESDQFFFVSRSNIDIIGNSPNFRDQDVFRLVGGLKGDLEVFGRDWFWDFAYTFGQTNATTRQSVIDGTRISFATDVVADGSGGQACRVTVETIDDPADDGGIPGTGSNASFTDCLPINILDFGSITPEAMKFVIQQQVQTTQLQQSVFEVNFAGSVFDLPAGEIGFAAGFTHRRERGSFDVGQGSQLGLPPQAPQVNVRGAFNTTEAYAETRIPIIADGEGVGPFGIIISDLVVEAAARIVDNSRSGSDVTWTAGGRLTPNLLDGLLTLRGNFTRAIRSPAIVELFLPQVTVGTFATDPCDQRDIESGNNPAVRRANCEAEAARLADTLQPGFDLDLFRAFSRNRSEAAITGGNPNLGNEQSTAFSVGGIITPDFILPGLSISVDWTDIQITDAIVNLSATNLLAACFDSTSFPNEPSCNRFTRDPMTFQASNFVTGFVNAASRRFRGLTVQANYVVDLSDIYDPLPGSMALSFNYFHTVRNDQQVGAGDLDRFQSERGFERNRWQAYAVYSLRGFTGFLQWRHDGKGVFDIDDPAEQRDFQGFPSYDEINLSANYAVNESLWVQLNVDNALDARNKSLRQASVGSNINILDDPIGRRFLFTTGVVF